MDAQPSSSWSYKLRSSINEEQDYETFCVSFNNVDPQHYKLLATCTGPKVTIYDCLPDGTFEPIQGYIDVEEEFYVVKWSKFPSTGAPLLLAAGLKGHTRVFNCNDQSILWTAAGHGSSINDIAIHPSNPELFVTASKDCTLRMWNLVTKVCVLIVNGDESHTNEVLSVDFNPFNPATLLSSGMDDTVKIWSFKENEKDIQRSREYDPEQGRSFKTAHVSHPVFSTRKVHWNYVDCARWMGDLILSKSVGDKILLWEPANELDSRVRTKQAKSGIHLLQSSINSSKYTHVSKDLVHTGQSFREFYLQNAKCWFIRFSMDPACKILACGNQIGQLFVFDLSAKSNVARKPKEILPTGVRQTIRQTAISADGSMIIACCSDASVHRFDRVYKSASSNALKSSRSVSVATAYKSET